MSMPTIAVAAAFGVEPLTTPGPGDWTDITPFVRAITITGGRDHELSRTQAGVCTLHLRNTDRRFDPQHAGGPYYPDVRPMTRVRVQAVVSPTTYDLFQGFVEDWGQVWNPRPLNAAGDAEVVVQAVDAFKLLTLHQLTPYSLYVQADAPVGYWKLGEASGPTAHDSGGGSLDGTFSGVTLGAGGPLLGGLGAIAVAGGFVDLDGPSALALAGDVTFEAWIRPTTTQLSLAGVFLGTDSNRYEFGQDSNGLYAMFTTDAFGAPVYQVGTPLPNLSWSHVVIIRDTGAKQVRFYVDGAATGTAHLGSTKPLIDSLFPFHANIGADASFFGGRFDGRLAHVALYDHVLSPDRIALHAAARFDTFAEQASGSHVDAVLDVVGWPAGERAIDPGMSTIQETLPTGSALDWLLRVAEDTENGRLYVDPGGRVTFLDRTSLWKSPRNSPQGLFTDEQGA